MVTNPNKVRPLLRNKLRGRQSRLEEIKDLELHKKASSYLCDNFHKFSEDKKMKLALALVQKFGITKIESDVNVTNLTEQQRANLYDVYRCATSQLN
jgi:hypothetical protein